VSLMISFDLNKIRKPYFGYEEIARVRGISLSSAKVTASRYVRQGLLLRLKKNLYVRREVWNAANKEDKFRLANLGQSPSYISLMTALAYYEITTQIQQNFFESVAIRRTKEIQVNGSVFKYSKINESLFFEFKKENGIFIASPEKALLDAFYLMSYGRYTIDISALNTDKLDRKIITQLSREFPLKTRNMLNKHGYLRTA
jgi:predicted transcriptional regulator of viral defense system